MQPYPATYDWIVLFVLIIVACAMYGCYVWGKRDGYTEGLKDGSRVKRELRRSVR
jgi:hypothetical protein